MDKKWINQNLFNMVKEKTVPFAQTTIKYLRDFILDNQISDNDSIALDVRLFDEMAVDYRRVYGEPLIEPFFFLGAWVKIADQRFQTRPGAMIIRDDPRPLPSQDTPISNSPVYRCGYCGTVVDRYGSELANQEYDDAIKRWKAHGDSIVQATSGHRCENSRQ
jgi:hypothetical protein